MLKNILPHRWIKTGALIVICQVLFYIAFVVGFYSLVQLICSLFSAELIPARRILFLALFQSFLLCAASACLMRILQALRVLLQNKTQTN